MQERIKKVIKSLKEKKIETLSEYLNKVSSNKKVFIYGAGAFGKEIFEVLSNNSINVSGFFDKFKKGQLLNKPIYSPKEFEDKDILIILSIVLTKSLREEILVFLKQLGFQNIIDAQEIRARYVEIENEEHCYRYFIENEKYILQPLTFLNDFESKETFVRNVSSHILRDYSNHMETDEKEQYFVKNIDFKKDYSYFIDCGAYNGDTFNKLLDEYSNVKEYIGFEPIKESYTQLIDEVKKNKVKATILPFAVSNKMKTVNFDNKLGSSSINIEGTERIQCIRLDDILINYSPSFIKMDIEGEEINALNGAKNLITNSNADLAICVYHYINHFWEIPNLINSWNLGYKFYLRAHSSNCMETVLYALKEEA